MESKTKDGVDFDIIMHSTDYAPNAPKYYGMSVGQSRPWVKLRYSDKWQMVEGERSSHLVRTILQDNTYVEGFKKLNLKIDVIEEIKRIVNDK